MQAWTPVKVINQELALYGQGGVCQGVPVVPKGKDETEGVVTVKMDEDAELVEFKVTDLQALA